MNEADFLNKMREAFIAAENISPWYNPECIDTLAKCMGVY